MKRCSKCSKLKPKPAFNRNARSSDGKQSWCRVCQITYQRTLRKNDRPPPRYDIAKETLEKYIALKLTNEQMARVIGCSTSTVALRRKKYGLSPGRHPPKPAEMPMQITEALTETLPSINPTLPILEMDISIICRAARLAVRELGELE